MAVPVGPLEIQVDHPEFMPARDVGIEEDDAVDAVRALVWRALPRLVRTTIELLLAGPFPTEPTTRSSVWRRRLGTPTEVLHEFLASALLAAVPSPDFLDLLTRLRSERGRDAGDHAYVQLVRVGSRGGSTPQRLQGHIGKALASDTVDVDALLSGWERQDTRPDAQRHFGVPGDLGEGPLEGSVALLRSLLEVPILSRALGGSRELSVQQVLDSMEALSGQVLIWTGDTPLSPAIGLDTASNDLPLLDLRDAALHHVVTSLFGAERLTDGVAWLETQGAKRAFESRPQEAPTLGPHEALVSLAIDEDGVSGEVGLARWPSGLSGRMRVHGPSTHVRLYRTRRFLCEQEDFAPLPLIAAFNDDALEVDDS
ncbi:MAG: hypothetical protein QF464_22055, partial [Myxococcota bacterium]|nr:hypothetical protein [Myxococcota bacterium]